MNPIRTLFVCIATAAAAPAPALDTSRPQIQAFIARMAEKYQFSSEELTALFSRVNTLQSTLTAIARPAESVLKWHEYRARFITERRFAEGIEFWQQHRELIEGTAQARGVAPEYLVAILGIETFYGRITGRDRVIDTLSTLAFDYPPRSPFFSSELEQFLLLTREEAIDPLSPLGSYAGAMGPPQFMPSNVRKLGLDGDGDGKRDLISDWPDILASIANYFRHHGWKTGEPVMAEASIDQARAHDIDTRKPQADETVGSLREKGVVFDPCSGVDRCKGLPADAPAMLIAADYPDGIRFRVAFHNFNVIRRYNPPLLYDMAVHDLATELVARVFADEKK